MENIEAAELLKAKKEAELDPYGLSTHKINSDELEINTSPYDAFIMQDTIRYVTCADRLAEIKETMKERINPETGLYRVTVDSQTSEYYAFATMFNRLTNPAYARNVYKSVALMKDLLSGIKKDYTEVIKQEIGRIPEHENERTVTIIP